jgi:hypothetical protein
VTFDLQKSLPSQDWMIDYYVETGMGGTDPSVLHESFSVCQYAITCQISLKSKGDGFNVGENSGTGFFV